MLSDDGFGCARLSKGRTSCFTFLAFGLNGSRIIGIFFHWFLVRLNASRCVFTPDLPHQMNKKDDQTRMKNWSVRFVDMLIKDWNKPHKTGVEPIKLTQSVRTSIVEQSENVYCISCCLIYTLWGFFLPTPDFWLVFTKSTSSIKRIKVTLHTDNRIAAEEISACADRTRSWYYISDGGGSRNDTAVHGEFEKGNVWRAILAPKRYIAQAVICLTKTVLFFV